MGEQLIADGRLCLSVLERALRREQSEYRKFYVFSTQVLVEQRHFRSRWKLPFDQAGSLDMGFTIPQLQGGGIISKNYL